jgi:2-aminoadipate transaminase
MRLNFSGVGEADIREGVRRIGEVVGEQLELFGALTGSRPAPAAPEREAAAPDDELADVFHLPRKQAGEARRSSVDRRAR